MKLKLLFILFHLVISIGFSQKSDFKHINFKKADSIANLYKNAELTNLPLLSYKLTYRLNTDVEKFRAIYFWVCNNISSDYSLTNKILNKGKKYRNNRTEFLEWNETLMPKFLKRLLKDKKTMCTGYAFLVKELSRLSNIECDIVNGFHKSPDYDFEKPFVNHSWNRVNYPEDEKWMLTNNESSFKNFIDFPIIYSHTYKHKITPRIPEHLKTKVSINEKIPFEFYVDTDLNIEKITLMQSNGWKEVKIPMTDYSYKNGVLKFNHKFSKKGLYDVHIKISDNIVTSYTIKVI